MSIVGFDHVQLAMPKGGEERARDFYGGVLAHDRDAEARPSSRRAAAPGSAPARSSSISASMRDFRPARKAHPALLVRGLADYVARARARGVPHRR